MLMFGINTCLKALRENEFNAEQKLIKEINSDEFQKSAKKIKNDPSTLFYAQPSIEKNLE